MAGFAAVIDLGTQSIRGTALDAEGRVAYSKSYPVATVREGERCEQDPRAWRMGMERLLEELTAATADRIIAVIATGTLSGLVCVDSQGEPLRPAILYSDARPRAQADRIRTMPEFLEANAASGWRVHSGDFLPQVLYVAEAEPAVYAQARWLLDATGYLTYLLTGAATMDAFTRFHCYGPAREERLPEELLCALGLDPAKLGVLQRIGQPVGEWRGRPVFASSFDSICAYLGAGLRDEGDALDISGTVTSFGVLHRRQVIDADRRIYSLPWMGRGEWLVRGSTAMSGGILEWARREIVGGDFATFDGLAMASEPGAGGVTFLPYLAGERAPLWSERATGTFSGITPNTTRADLARAVYEGLCYALRHIQSVIASQDVAIGQVRLAGGLARNALLTRIKSDITGRTLRPLADPELTTRGCAAIVGVSLGWYADLRTAQDVLTSAGAAVEPMLDGRYEEGFARYLRLVDALSPLFR
ncbi:MAG TPA: FGGY-family carbohydrate kinase [Bryobacteraceae bacterium]|nr:FGGY-family carbohydrate kinase [Bryobacteraceae bacterium]